MLASRLLTYMRNTKKSVYYASNYTHEEKTTTYPVHYHRLRGGVRSDGIRGHDAGQTGLWESSIRPWRRIQRLVTRFCSRHDGLCAEGNLQRRPGSTQASKPSAWKKMSISPPARPTITESAKTPSMAAFLVAILIPFPRERRGST